MLTDLSSKVVQKTCVPISVMYINEPLFFEDSTCLKCFAHQTSGIFVAYTILVRIFLYAFESYPVGFFQNVGMKLQRKILSSALEIVISHVFDGFFVW